MEGGTNVLGEGIVIFEGVGGIIYLIPNTTVCVGRGGGGWVGGTKYVCVGGGVVGVSVYLRIQPSQELVCVCVCVCVCICHKFVLVKVKYLRRPPREGWIPVAS